jgi:nitrite reductase/ring-hydroxylating ferredoxin subunit
MVPRRSGMASSGESWLSVPADVLGEDGRAVIATTEGEIALLRVDGQLYAVDNACPHEGNPLFEADVLGQTLVCIYHRWSFDLQTGACLAGEEPVRCYPVEARGDRIWIDLS